MSACLSRNARRCRPVPLFASKYEKATWETEIAQLPTVIHGTKGTLAERETIIGLVRNGAAQAYPLSNITLPSPVLLDIARFHVCHPGRRFPFAGCADGAAEDLITDSTDDTLNDGLFAALDPAHISLVPDRGDNFRWLSAAFGHAALKALNPEVRGRSPCSLCRPQSFRQEPGAL